MAEGLQRRTAEIIPFAPRLRLDGAKTRRHADIPAPLPAAVATIPLGGCWYHDAALRDDETPRKG